MKKLFKALKRQFPNASSISFTIQLAPIQETTTQPQTITESPGRIETKNVPPKEDTLPSLQRTATKRRRAHLNAVKITDIEQAIEHVEPIEVPKAPIMFKNPRRITPEILDKIKKALNTKLPRTKIANHFGVSVTTIDRIRDGGYG